MHIKQITTNYLCSGCGACIQACNNNALSMNKSSMGHVFPIINEDKCTQCGLCYNICPCTDETGLTTLHEQDPFIGHYKAIYTGRSLNDTIYRNAQSGGLVTQTLSYLFDMSKIDAALVCKTDYGKDRPIVKSVVISKKEDLLETQRSSYTYIDMLSSLKYIDNYHSVAIVGLPCHLQGIDALIHKLNKYHNIHYKLGLMCDRILSETAADMLIHLVTTKNNSQLAKKIIWRDKRHNYQDAPVVIEFENKESITIPVTTRYMLKEIFTYPRCRICFDKLNIHADIVFGDPWGMSNIDRKYGDSVVMTRTICGDSLISEILKNNTILLHEASFDELLQGQHIEQRRIQVKTYFQAYEKMGWQLPKYKRELKLEHYTPPLKISMAKRAIKSYLVLDKKPVSEIIKIVSSELQRKKSINMIKSNLKKILHKMKIISFIRGIK